MKAKDILITCIIGILSCALYDVSKNVVLKVINNKKLKEI